MGGISLPATRTKEAIMRTTLLATLALTAAPGLALAATWTVDPAASTLTFTGKQANDAFTGSFTQFTPVVEFDPLKPESAKITVTVDIASATIDDKDKQDSLPTSDWFDAAKFPTATFTSTRVTSLSSQQGTYAAEGNLTLHGTTKPAILKFTFAETGGKATVDGTAELNRNDFGVGSGQWKSDEWIAYPVDVKFHLVATKG